LAWGVERAQGWLRVYSADCTAFGNFADMGVALDAVRLAEADARGKIAACVQAPATFSAARSDAGPVTGSPPGALARAPRVHAMRHRRRCRRVSAAIRALLLAALVPLLGGSAERLPTPPALAAAGWQLGAWRAMPPARFEPLLPVRVHAGAEDALPGVALHAEPGQGGFVWRPLSRAPRVAWPGAGASRRARRRPTWRAAAATTARSRSASASTAGRPTPAPGRGPGTPRRRPRRATTGRRCRAAC
jgi:hypothetical protein